MGKITIPIEAVIQGYQKSLNEMKDAIAHLKVGDKFSDEIINAYKRASDEVKKQSKNLNPQVASESQLKGVIGQVNNLGDAIANVGRMLSQVQGSNLNFDSFGSTISDLTKKITDLENKFQGSINQGLRDFISNSSDLQNVFTKLHFDTKGKTSAEIFEALSKGAKQAERDVKNATAAVQQARQNLTNVQNQKMDTTKISDVINNREVITTSLRDNYFSALNHFDYGGIRDILSENLKKIFPQDENTQKQLLDGFINNLTSGDLHDKIIELRNRIQSALKSSGTVMSASDIYKSLFGDFAGNGKTARLDTVTSNLLSQFSLTDEQAQQFAERFRSIRNTILKADGLDKNTTESLKQIFGLKTLDADTLAAEILKVLEAAYQKAQSEWNTKHATAVTNADSKLQDALQKEAIAIGNKNDIGNAQTALETHRQDILLKLEAQQKQIDDLRAQLQAFKEGKVAQVKQQGQLGGDAARSFQIGADQAAKYEAQLERVKSAEKFVGKLQGVVERWFSIYAVVRMVSRAIKQVTSDIKELDKTITEISIVTNMSSSDLWGQMKTYTDMARQYAASISGVYEVSKLYYQQGLQTNDVMALTEQTLKMARISGLDYADATNYMTNAIRSFKMEMTEAQRVVDVYSALAASSATSTAELAEAMSKTASSAQAVGSSFENTTAMMAVMIEATREAPQNIGSAMKSIISRYGELKTDPKKLVDSEGEELSLNKVDTALKSVGISLHDATGQFRNFDDVIMELAESWDTIDTNTQRYIATVMAGNRQQSRFLALVSSYDRLKELSEEAANSENASQLQMLKTLDSIQAKTQQLKTSLQQLYTSSGLENAYRDILNIGNAIIKNFSSMDTIAKRPIAAIVAFGQQFFNLANIVMSVFKIIKLSFSTQEQNLTLQVQLAVATRETLYAEEAFNEAKAKRTATTELERLEHEYTEAVRREKAIRDSILLSGNGANIGSGTLIGGNLQKGRGLSVGLSLGSMALSGIGAAANQSGNSKLAGWMNVGSSALSMASMGMMTGNPAVAVAMGIGGLLIGLFSNLSNIVQPISERLKKAREDAEAANNERLTKINEVKSLREQIDEIKKLEAARYDSVEAEEEYYEATSKLAEKYPQLISSIDESGNVTIDLIAAENELTNARIDAVDAAKKALVANYQANETQTEADREEINKALSLGAGVNGTTAHATVQRGFDMIIGQLFNDITLGQVANANFLKWGSNGLGLSSVQYSASDLQDWIQDNYNSLNDQSKAIIGIIQDENNEGLDILEKVQAFIYSERENNNWNIPNIGEIDRYGNVDYNNLTEDALANYVILTYAEQLSNNNLIGKYRSNRAIGITSYKSDLLRLAQGEINYYDLTNPKYEALGEMSGAVQLFANYINQDLMNFIENDFLTGDEIEDYFQEGTGYYDTNHVAQKAITQILNFWDNLDEIQQEGFNYLIDNYSNLSRSQFISELTDIYGMLPEVAEQFADSYYTNTYDKEWLKQAITEGTETRKNSSLRQNLLDKIEEQSGTVLDELGARELQKILQMYDNITALIDEGAISEANGQKYFDTYLDLWDKIESDDSLSLEAKESLQKLLYDWDGTISGLLNIQEAINEASQNSQNYEEDFNTLAKIIPQNLNTLMNNFSTAYTQGLENYNKIQDKILKGVSYEDAVDVAKRVGQNVSDLFTLDQSTNKWVAKAEQLTTIRSAYLDNVEDEFNNINRYYDALLNLNSRRGEDNFDLAFALFQDGLWSDETYSLLSNKLGINEQVLKDIMRDFEKSGENDFFKFLSNYIHQYQDIMADYTNQMATSFLSAGDIESFIGTVLGREYDSTKDKGIYNAILSQNFDLLRGTVFNGYINLLQKTLKDIQKNVFTSFTNYLNNGELIEVTTQNIDFIRSMSGNENIKVGDFVDGFKDYDSAINYLTGHWRSMGMTLEEANSELTKINKSKNQQYLGESITKFAQAYDNFSYDVASEIATSLGITTDAFIEAYNLDSLDGGNLTLGLEESIDLIRQLYDSARLSVKDYNKAIAAAYQRNRELSASSVITEIINNRDKLQEKDIESLANLLDADYNNVLKMLIQNDDGTYRIDLSTIKALVNKFGLATNQAIQKLITQIYDDAIKNITDLASKQTSGFNNLSDISEYTNNINKALGTAFSYSDLFEWSESVHAFVLTQEGISSQVKAYAQQMMYMSTEEAAFAQQFIQESGRVLAEAIDIFGYLDSDDTNRETNLNNLKIAIENYNEYLASIGASGAIYIDSLIAALDAGGMAAVAAGQTIANAQGKTLTASEIETLYTSQAKNITDQIEVMEYSLGSIVNATAAGILRKAGYGLQEIGNTGQYIIQSAGNLTNAYNQLYYELLHTGETTLNELNKLRAKYRTASSDTQLVSALQNATSMTWESLADIFTQAGIRMSSWLERQMLESGLISDIGNGNIRINDFEKFAQLTGLNRDTNSEAYTQAYNAYVDGLVEIDRQTETNIKEQINAISEAKPGSKLNLSYLYLQLTEDQLNKLNEELSQYGAGLHQGILDISANGDIYNIIQAINSAALEYGVLIDSDMAELADALDSVLKALIDVIIKGINGTLNHSEMNNLITSAKNMFGINDLQFTQTSEGFKLAADSAVELYSAMAQTSALAAKPVFDELVKKFTAAGEACETMSSTMAAIKNLTGDTSNEAKRLLNIYQQIAMVQMDNPEAYSFMDNQLSNGMQSPLNYWNSIGDMFTAINEAKSNKNLMGVQDFYNIVNEMNNLATLGENIEILGYTLDGSLESASQLIQAGMATLTNIDGKGAMINLADFGTQFLSGANSMENGVEDGIHAMAQSQIDMLDGLINLLEAVVAMEELGDITGEDNKLDFEDMFNIEGDVASFTEGASTWAQNILEAAKTNEELANSLDSIIFNGTSLRQMLQDGINNANLTKEQAEEYFAAINSLYQMYLSGEYDEEHLIESILTISEQSGYEGEIKVGDKKFAIRFGTVFTTDKDGNYVWNDKEYSTLEQAVNAMRAEQLFGKDADLQELLDNEGHPYLLFKSEYFQVQIKDGAFDYISIDGQHFGEDYEAAIAKSYEYLMGTGSTGLSFEEYRAQALGQINVEAMMQIKPRVLFENEDQAKKDIFAQSAEAVEELQTAIAQRHQQDVIDWFVEYGIKINSEMENSEWTMAEWDQLQQLANVESKTMRLNITMEGDAKTYKPLGELLSYGELYATMHVKVVKDDPDEVLGKSPTDGNAAGNTANRIISWNAENASEYYNQIGTETAAARAVAARIQHAQDVFYNNMNDSSRFEQYQNQLQQEWNNKLAEEKIRAIQQQATAVEQDSLKRLNNVETNRFNDYAENNIDERHNQTEQINSLIQAAHTLVDYGDINPLSNFDDFRFIYDQLNLLTQTGNINKIDEKFQQQYPYLIDIALAKYRENLQSNQQQQQQYTSTPMGNNSPSIPEEVFNNTTQNAAEEVSTSVEDAWAEAAETTQTSAETIQTSAETMDASTKNFTDAVLELYDIYLHNGNSLMTASAEEVFARHGIKGMSSPEAIINYGTDIGIRIDPTVAAIISSIGSKGGGSWRRNAFAFAQGKGENELLSNLNEQFKLLNNDVKNIYSNLITKTNASIPEKSTEKIVTQPSNVKSETALTAKDIMASLSSNKEGYDKAIAAANENLKETPQLIQQLADIGQQAFSALTAAANSAWTKIRTLDNALYNLTGIHIIPVNLKITAEVQGAKLDSHEFTGGGKTVSITKGNVALSRGTLMGELGPELVVSGGRYFLVGQNGAEMVDLDDDAIVFNHLQTKRLMSGGHGGHGIPITNERNATSYATGNVEGPAMASAAAALASLKQIRAMWQAMLDASLRDLGQQAGGSGGGGGGGGGKELDPGLVEDFERWYNLLRQIASIEKEINYEEKLRAKISGDLVSNGREYYESQKRSLQLLNQEIAKNQNLSGLKKSYYDARRQDLASTGFGQILTFNENGLMQYNDKGKMANGDTGGLFALAKLNATDVTTGASIYTAKEQYELLKAWGFEEELKYDASGKKIDMSGDEGYTNAVQAFWDKIDAWKDELDGLYDDYHQTLLDVLDEEQSRNEILKAMQDNQLTLEDKILNAIEEREQKIIDKLEEEKDALKDATDAYLDGLNKQLEQNRKMYEDNKNDDELNTLRRQLAILQRSGGSASQIRSLQNQISEKEQDKYFDVQQDQIDAIQDASDKEIERLEQQIDIMNETLAYQKENGLLWEEVYQIMEQTPEEIEEFLREWSPEFLSDSALKQEQTLQEIRSIIYQYTTRRDDPEDYLEMERYKEGEYGWQRYISELESIYEGNSPYSDEVKEAARQEYLAHYAKTSDPNDAMKAAYAVLDAYMQKNREAFIRHDGDTSVNGTNTGSGGGSSGGGGSFGGSSSNNSNNTNNSTNKNYNHGYSFVINGTIYTKDGFASTVVAKNAAVERIKQIISQNNLLSAAARKIIQENAEKTIKAYESGGLADYTGLAMVHGSKTRPEAFLNAEDTQTWREDILSGRKGSLTANLLDFNHGVQTLIDSGVINNNNSTSNDAISIETLEFNMNATISSDYDARRAAESAMDEIVKIARKTSVQSIRR